MRPLTLPDLATTSDLTDYTLAEIFGAGMPAVVDSMTALHELDKQSLRQRLASHPGRKTKKRYLQQALEASSQRLFTDSHFMLRQWVELPLREVIALTEPVETALRETPALVEWVGNPALTELLSSLSGQSPQLSESTHRLLTGQETPDYPELTDYDWTAALQWVTNNRITVGEELDQTHQLGVILLDFYFQRLLHEYLLTLHQDLIYSKKEPPQTTEPLVEAEAVELDKGETEKLAITSEKTPSSGIKSDYLTAKQAAQVLGISIHTLYQKTSNKEIAFYKPGKHLHFKLTDLQTYIEQGKQKDRSQIAKSIFDSKTTKHKNF